MSSIPPQTSAPSWPSLAMRSCVLAAAYFALGSLSTSLSIDAGRVAPWYPPAGLALAAIVLWGPRYAIAIGVGALLLAWKVQHLTLPWALPIAAVSVGAALAGACLLRGRRDFDASLRRLPDVGAFVALGAIVPATLAALLGSGVLWLSGRLDAEHVWSACGTWWLGDMAGVLLVGALALAWNGRAPAQRTSLPPSQLALVLLAVGASGVVAFGRILPPALERASLLLVFPGVVWAALRSGPRGATAVVLLISSAAVFLTLPSLQLAALFGCVLALTALPAAALQAERARAEEQARASRERFELAVSGSAGGLWEWDLESDRVEYSPRFLELLGMQGIPPGQRGDSFRAIVHAEDHAVFEAAVREHLERGEPYEVDLRLRLASGELRWFHARGVALRDARGRTRRMAGSIRDVHQQKVTEEELARRAGELEAARDVEASVREVITLLDEQARARA